MELTHALLSESSNIAQFDCGEKALNDFLKNSALLFQNRHFGVTIVITEKEDPAQKVIAYYTLCPAHIERAQLPNKFMKGPQPNPLPAFRLCRLGVDKAFQGKRIGESVLMHALKRCYEISLQLGGTAVIVDAKHDNAACFYEKYGFQKLSSLPSSLIISMKDIQKTI